MPVWNIPAPFRYYTAKQSTVTVRGQTVSEALSDLTDQFPALERHLFKPDGDLRAYVNLFVGETNIKELQGLKTPVSEDDELRLVPSIAGG